MPFAGYRIFRTSLGDAAARDAWVSDFEARCNALLGLPSADGVTLRAFTPIYEFPDGSGGVAAPIDSSYASVEQPGDPPIEAEQPPGWGLPPDDGNPNTPGV